MLGHKSCGGKLHSRKGNLVKKCLAAVLLLDLITSEGPKRTESRVGDSVTKSSPRRLAKMPAALRHQSKVTLGATNDGSCP